MVLNNGLELGLSEGDPCVWAGAMRASGGSAPYRGDEPAVGSVSV